MPWPKCKCGVELSEFDVLDAVDVVLLTDPPCPEPKYKVDLIMRCPACNLAYNAFIPFDELMVLEDE